MNADSNNDAVICSICNYRDYAIIKPWINSIRKTGFTGDVVIVAINVPNEICEQAINAGVYIYRCTDASSMHPNVLRFKYISEYLKTKTYSKVVVTDARDVVFQANPFNYLYRLDEKYKIVASSENILIKNEPWMRDNLISTFGVHVYENIKDTEALCAGVIAGDSEHVARLCDEVFTESVLANGSASTITGAWNEREHWSTWSKDPADQAAYNVLLRSIEWADLLKVCGTDEDWNINIGVSQYNSRELLIHDNGHIEHDIVKNSSGQVFHVLHQYDRIYQLKNAVLDRYANGQ